MCLRRNKGLQFDALGWLILALVGMLILIAITVIFSKKGELPQKLVQNPDSESLQKGLVELLAQAMADGEFQKELRGKVEQLQSSGIKEKNIVKGAIEYIQGSVRIGDKNPESEENYDRKDPNSGKA